jgi:UDP-N-acetylmuramate dehydrogenase
MSESGMKQQGSMMAGGEGRLANPMPLELPSGLVIRERVALAPFTSWLVGGAADFLAEPRDEQQLREAIAWAQVAKLPITYLSGGTNVLVSDRGVRGLTILLRKLAGSKTEIVEGDGASKRLQIECLAGTGKSELLKTFLKNKLEPALFLAGLPGDVGGGVVMNAGVGEAMRPREFVELTDWVEVLREPTSPVEPSTAHDADPLARIAKLASSFELVRIPASKLEWSYRHCEGWRPGVLVRVGLSWPFEPVDDILVQVKQANHLRLTKQPLDRPSCGSVFRNPPGHKSGQLIERAGLKGFTIGGAQVSEKHANFIVNTGEARASEIDQVIQHVRRTVLAQAGVELKTEVVYLGEW